MWKEIEKQIGRVAVGEPQQIKFEYKGKEEFISATSSCGCTTPIWDNKTNSIYATYTPKPIPVHIKQQGKNEYSTIKSITVKMEGEDKPIFYTLKFYATVYDSNFTK